MIFVEFKLISSNLVDGLIYTVCIVHDTTDQ
jgi:hypothetical protein